MVESEAGKSWGNLNRSVLWGGKDYFRTLCPLDGHHAAHLPSKGLLSLSCSFMNSRNIEKAFSMKCQ